MSDSITVEVDEDLEDLIPGFLENRKNDTHKISDFVQNQDFAEIQSLGHSLKGVGGGYGFDEITRLGAEIETAAKQEDSETIKALNEQLSQYLNAVNVVFV